VKESEKEKKGERMKERENRVFVVLAVLSFLSPPLPMPNDNHIV
jgi:hypothetical protein